MMRSAFTAFVLFGTAALLTAQPPKEAPKDPPKEAPKEAPKAAPKDDEFSPAAKEAVTRYGVNPRVKAYPQLTPKDTLRSAVAAIDKSDFAYIAAHLLEPKSIDRIVAERGKSYEVDALAELVRARDAQKADPVRFPPEVRLPGDGPAFTALVVARARERAFRQLAKDLEQKLADDPLAVKDMRRVLRAENPYSVTDPTATASLPEVKGRALYFTKLDGRWFLENRQVEEAAPAPKKEP